MPTVQCPFCSVTLASAMTEQRARELAVIAKADHLCKLICPMFKEEDGSKTWLSSTRSEPSSAGL